MAVLPRNTSVNLDVVISSSGATLGGGLTTERKFSWVGSAADMTLVQPGSLAATYNLPNLTSAPSTTVDTLIGYSTYSSAAGTLLYGGAPVAGTNVAPVVLAPGGAGTALQVGPGGTSLQWLPLASTTWVAATTPSQVGVAGNGYYVPAGAGACAFSLPTSPPIGTYIAIYSAGTGASWTITLSAQTIQFGMVSPSTSLSSNSAGDGLWMLSTGSTSWLVLTAIGNITYV